MKYELVKLNTARNCLRYVIRAFEISEIYLPFYLCPAVRISAKKENCKIKFYHIDINFKPIKEFPKNAFILYPDYFGVCGNIIKKLAEEYDNLIVDNAHSFYSKPIGIASFNSLRKFFPTLRDGAFLYTKKTLNENFIKDTYEYDEKILDYKELCENEKRLDCEDIKLISDCTLNRYNSLDLKAQKEILIQHFNKYQQKYGKINNLPENSIPFKYPYLAETKEIAAKIVNESEKDGITIYRFWNNLPKNYTEYPLYERLVAI